MSTHLAKSSLVDEELPQVVDGVMSFDRFVLVDDARRQILLVSLTLEDCTDQIQYLVVYEQEDYSLFSSTVPVATNR